MNSEMYLSTPCRHDKGTLTKSIERRSNDLGENTCIRMHHNTEPPISHDIYIMMRSSENASEAIELATSPPALAIPSPMKRRSCQTSPLNVLSSFIDPVCVDSQDDEFCYLIYR